MKYPELNDSFIHLISSIEKKEISLEEVQKHYDVIVELIKDVESDSKWNEINDIVYLIFTQIESCYIHLEFEKLRKVKEVIEKLNICDVDFKIVESIFKKI